MTQPLALVGAYAALTAAGAGVMALPWAYAAAGLATLMASLTVMGSRGVRPRAGDLAWVLTALVVLGALAVWSAR